MVHAAHATIPKCGSCVRNEYRHRRQLHLLSESGHFAFIAMDIVRPLLETNQDSQNTCKMIHQYPNLAQTISMSKAKSTHAAYIFYRSMDCPIGHPRVPFDGQRTAVCEQVLYASLQILGRKTFLGDAMPSVNLWSSRAIQSNIVTCLPH